MCQRPGCAHWLTDAEEFDVVRAVGARSSDPSTARRAALAMEPRLETQRGQILAAFRDVGRLTAREACRVAGIPDGWKRVSELEQGGHLVVVGETLDPDTRMPARVFAATGEARLFA